MFYSKLKAIFLTELTRGYLEGAHRLLLLHVVSLFHAFVYIQIPLKNEFPSFDGLFFPGGCIFEVTTHCGIYLFPRYIMLSRKVSHFESKAVNLGQPIAISKPHQRQVP